MSVPTLAEVLVETAASLRRHPRVVLCQIVRVEGSTPGKPGWRLLVRPDGSTFGNLGGGAFEAMVAVDARARLAVSVAGSEPVSEVKRFYLTEQATRGEATGMVCGGLAEVFLEVMTAAPLLVLCGGGPVSQATARAGALAGFEILVAEDRAPFRRPDDFPPGTAFAAVDRDYSQPFLAEVASRDLYVACLSRCWETDLAALASVVRQAPAGMRYLGLMGSERKVRRVRAELASRGLEPRALHAPIGLPIGGTTPGEIAISILAQVVEVRNRSRTECTAASSPSPSLSSSR
jgi:xanthine dehydrogenase accessory factor